MTFQLTSNYFDHVGGLLYIRPPCKSPTARTLKKKQPTVQLQRMLTSTFRFRVSLSLPQAPFSQGPHILSDIELCDIELNGRPEQVGFTVL